MARVIVLNGHPIGTCVLMGVDYVLKLKSQIQVWFVLQLRGPPFCLVKLRETCVFHILFFMHPLYVGYETHDYCKMIDKRQIVPKVISLIIFKVHVNILSIIEGNILMVIQVPSSILLFKLEWLAYFDHKVHYLLKTCLFGILPQIQT